MIFVDCGLRCTSHPGNATWTPADINMKMTSRTANRVRPHLPWVGMRSNGWFQIILASSDNPSGAS
eukprot:715881-Pyramimonas_sp.AAC.1